MVTLVAPAGAGKTLGVAGWLRRAGSPSALGGVTWLDAARDLDASRLSDALGEAAPRTRGGTPSMVVVDDAHHLGAEAISVLDTWLDAAPQHLRVVLISRWDLPLTRLPSQLLGHLTEMRGDILRLTPDESEELIGQHLGPTDPEVLAGIASRAGGWCAALVLAARLVAASPDRVETVRRMSDGTSPVTDQVVNEVFSTLTSRERHLLLCTASEGEVSAATAVHLTRDHGAGLVLDGLVSTGLLVTRSQPRPPALPYPATSSSAAAADTAFRIHPLLVEVVRRRLAAGGVDVERARATVLRAVRLDIARGAPDKAFGRLVDLGLAEAAAEQMVEQGTRLLTRGQAKEVVAFARRWPDAVEAHPEGWFVLAVERWMNGDVTSAMHWLDRLCATRTEPGPRSDRMVAQRLCARVMRARAGFELLAPAVEDAQAAVDSNAFASTPSELQPQLLAELGIAQMRLGHLGAAETNLARAARLGDELELPAHAAGALTHLAAVYFMRGRERVAEQLAGHALASLQQVGTDFPIARRRAELYAELAAMSTLPPRVAEPEDRSAEGALHPADVTTHVWHEILTARKHLARGSVISAEQTLQAVMGVNGLPQHLRATVLIERGFLAALGDDHTGLRGFAAELAAHGSLGESMLLQGLVADLTGDVKVAIGHFATAADLVVMEQPPCRPLALVCRAQLLHARGDLDAARASMSAALRSTESRSNYVPFLGWTRHGTAVHALLGELVGASPDPWLDQLLDLTRAQPDITASLAPSTATSRERSSGTAPLVTASLSPRERDVLRELARGATYADIALGLFVSENTVKTHVSSLYSKLGASRRSEALSVARRLELL